MPYHLDIAEVTLIALVQDLTDRPALAKLWEEMDGTAKADTIERWQEILHAMRDEINRTNRLKND